MSQFKYQKPFALLSVGVKGDANGWKNFLLLDRRAQFNTRTRKDDLLRVGGTSDADKLHQALLDCGAIPHDGVTQAGERIPARKKYDLVGGDRRYDPQTLTQKEYWWFGKLQDPAPGVAAIQHVKTTRHVGGHDDKAETVLTEHYQAGKLQDPAPGRPAVQSERGHRHYQDGDLQDPAPGIPAIVEKRILDADLNKEYYQKGRLQDPAPGVPAEQVFYCWGNLKQATSHNHGRKRPWSPKEVAAFNKDLEALREKERRKQPKIPEFLQSRTRQDLLPAKIKR